MVRPLRIEYPGAWYHVLNRGRRKERIFFDEKDYEAFFTLLDEVTKQYKAEIHAYALMPNHYHLIIRTPLGNLSRIMRHINGVYTQIINGKYELEGSLFKGRYKSILIEADKYLLELIRYIHRNPYKAGLEKRLGDHKWTSHGAYLGKRKRPQWLVVNDVLQYFSKREKEAIKQLSLHVRKEPTRELEKQLDEFHWPMILGGEKFKDKIKDMILGKAIDSREISDYKRIQGQSIEAEDLLDVIKRKYGTAINQMLKKHSREYSHLKRAIIYVLRSDYQVKLREVGAVLGGVDLALITRHYKKASADMERGLGCVDDVRKIRRHIKSNVST